MMPMWLKRIVIILVAVAGAPATAHEAAEADSLLVSIARDGDNWTATFDFPQETQADAWGFFRSNRARELDASWRLASWEVRTQGAELVRIGETDVIRATGAGLPARVVVSFEPFAKDLLADYDPAMLFSDGTVALFGGHFSAAPWSQDSGLSYESGIATRLAYSDAAGPVTFKGERHDRLTTYETGAYAIFGSPHFLSTNEFTGLLDPEIPAWMLGELQSLLPRTLELLTEELGTPSLEGKPMILATWAGPTPGLVSQGGSVLEGMVTLRFEGDGILSPSREALGGARWFLAHEAAHFWLGQTVGHPDASQAWMNEGGASLIAYRLIERIDPEYNADGALSAHFDKCLTLSQNGPLAGADNRRDYEANYSCGAVLSQIAEAAAARNDGRDFFDFWRTLVDANRADRGGDGFVSVSDWIAQISLESGDTSLAADLRSFVHDGAPDPQAALCAMSAKVDLSHPACAQ